MATFCNLYVRSTDLMVTRCNLCGTDITGKSPSIAADGHGGDWCGGGDFDVLGAVGDVSGVFCFKH